MTTAPTPQSPLDVEALKFLSTEPLRGCLRYLSDMALRLPPQGFILRWGRQALELQPDQVGPWFARAWWGAAAARLVTERLTLGHTDEVMDLLLPVDLTPLERVHAGGRGAILAISHLGPWAVVRAFLQDKAYDVLILANHPDATQGNLRVHDVSTLAGRRKSLATGLLHLRRNGVLLAAGDGEFGEGLRPCRFMNHHIAFRSGLAGLARLADAPTLWLFTLWDPMGRGLRILLEDPGLRYEPGEAPEAWEHRWLSAYADRLQEVMEAHPESLGFRGGLWGAAHGGFMGHHRGDQP